MNDEKICELIMEAEDIIIDLIEQPEVTDDEAKNLNIALCRLHKVYEAHF